MVKFLIVSSLLLLVACGNYDDASDSTQSSNNSYYLEISLESSLIGLWILESDSTYDSNFELLSDNIEWMIDENLITIEDLNIPLIFNTDGTFSRGEFDSYWWIEADNIYFSEGENSHLFINLIEIEDNILTLTSPPNPDGSFEQRVYIKITE